MHAGVGVRKGAGDVNHILLCAQLFNSDFPMFCKIHVHIVIRLPRCINTENGQGNIISETLTKVAYLVGSDWTLLCFLDNRDPTGGLVLLQCFSGVADAPGVSKRCNCRVFILASSQSFFNDFNCCP